MYEHRTEPLLPRRSFLRRLASHVGVALLVVVPSLLLGTGGYHHFGSQPWLDAFLNASMLLGGMGQVGEVTGTAGKLFAACFALYAGLVLITISTIMLAPVVHRILHKLHLETPGADEGEAG